MTPLDLRRLAPILLGAAVAIAPACTTSGGDPGGNGSNSGGKTDGTGSACGSAGDVDTCFGTSGFARLSGISSTQYVSSALAGDGKILVFGTAVDADSGSANVGPFLRRLLADGSPDPSFHAQLPAAQGGLTFSPAAVAVRPDGEVLVTGSWGNQYGLVPYLAYLLPDGSADPAHGAAQLDPPNASNGSGGEILVNPDNSFYVLGTSKCEIAFTCDTSSIFVARFGANGALDTTYGTSGFALASAGPHTQLTDVVRDGDGLVLLGMEVEQVFDAGQEVPFDRVALARLDASGKLQTGFGTNGAVSWYESSDQFGTGADAVRVLAGGDFQVATAGLDHRLVTFGGTDGKLGADQAFFTEQLGRLESRFASDGTIFGVVDTYPWPSYARFASDGTPDASFHGTTVTVPGLPDGAASVGAEPAEASDAWVITSTVYLPNQTPDDAIVLYRILK